MKVGLKKKLYNAEIRNRRKALGLAQGELAKKIGVSDAYISQVECLRITKPQTPVIQKLAAFFDTQPEVLCPKWLTLLNDVPKELDEQRDITQKTLEEAAFSKVALPAHVPSEQEGEADRAFLRESIDRACKTLSFREREILKLRYGLGGGGVFSLAEVGRIFKITQERVRQTELKAVRKLSHPTRSRRLQGYLMAKVDKEASPVTQGGTQWRVTSE